MHNSVTGINNGANEIVALNQIKGYVEAVVNNGGIDQNIKNIVKEDLLTQLPVNGGRGTDQLKADTITLINTVFGQLVDQHNRIDINAAAGLGGRPLLDIYNEKINDLKNKYVSTHYNYVKSTVKEIFPQIHVKYHFDIVDVIDYDSDKSITFKDLVISGLKEADSMGVMVAFTQFEFRDLAPAPADNTLHYTVLVNNKTNVEGTYKELQNEPVKFATSLTLNLSGHVNTGLIQARNDAGDQVNITATSKVIYEAITEMKKLKSATTVKKVIDSLIL